eukprot:scaffold7.g3491.t1
MPQGVLKKKAPAKKAVANRHGKGAVTKKGERGRVGMPSRSARQRGSCRRRLDKAPKKTAALKGHKESMELTKAINAENEQHFAGAAASSGGRLAVLKPPVGATADEKQRAKAAKAGKAPVLERSLTCRGSMPAAMDSRTRVRSLSSTAPRQRFTARHNMERHVGSAARLAILALALVAHAIAAAAQTCPFAELSVVRCPNDGGIFRIVNSKRKQFSPEAYAAQGYPTWTAVDCARLYKSCPPGANVALPKPKALEPDASPSGSCPWADGSIVRCNATGAIYLIWAETRQNLSPDEFKALGYPAWMDVDCDQVTTCTLPAAGQCPFPDQSVVRCPTSGAIYLVKTKTRNLFSSGAYKTAGLPAYIQPGCGLINTCRSPTPNPPALPTAAAAVTVRPAGGACSFADLAVVYCTATDEYFVILGGRRYPTSPTNLASTASVQRPACGQIYDCALGAVGLDVVLL